MSIVTYGTGANAITIPYAFSTQFHQEAVAEESGTDRYLSKFDLIFQGVLNADYIQAIAPAINGKTTNPADIMGYIHTNLMKYQQKLSVTFNGVDLIPNIPGVSVDAMNGPKPQSCNILLITNTTFLVTWHVIAHYWVNGKVGAQSPLMTNQSPASPVLYNRWSERVDIDQLNLSKRVRTGKFAIASNNSQGNIADELRLQMAVVGIPDTCVRDHANYNISPDGLTLEYEIADQETFKLPPILTGSTPAKGAKGAPAGNPLANTVNMRAYKATGWYGESAPRANGMRWLECYVKLEGAKFVPQAALVQTAIAIAVSKVQAQTNLLVAKPNDRGIITEAALKLGLYDNWAEFHTRRQVAATRDRFDALQLLYTFGNSDARSLTNTPGSDGEKMSAPMFYPRGTIPFLLQAAAYYDPSLAHTLNQATGQMTPGREPGRRGG